MPIKDYNTMKKILLNILLLSSSFILNIKAQVWEVAEIGVLPTSVSNNAVCEGFVNNQAYIYSFSGVDATKSQAGIHLHSYRVNTSTGVAEVLADLPDNSGKIAAAANRVGDTIYIIGGYHVLSNGSEVSSSKVHRFSTQTNSFLTNGLDIPIAIDDHVQAVWSDSLIFVITGWSNTTNVPNVQIYNPYFNTWQVGNSTPNNHNYKSFGASGTIVGDTIYYFGGAASNFSFSVQNQLRKGYINPNNPTDITWDFEVVDSQMKGYRMACTNVGNQIHWLGGSNETYNYDGIAYNNTGGVEPNNRDLYYNTTGNSFWVTNFTNNYPMDLRGIAAVNDSLKYLAGGMLANQTVTNKVYELKWHSSLTSVSEHKAETILSVYPNPVYQNKNLNIRLSKNDNEKALQVFSLDGKIVIQKKTNASFYTLVPSVLSKGIYVIKVTEGDKIQRQRFVVN